MVSIVLVDARKTSLTGVQNSKKKSARRYAARTSPLGQPPPPPWKKARSAPAIVLGLRANSFSAGAGGGVGGGVNEWFNSMNGAPPPPPPPPPMNRNYFIFTSISLNKVAKSKIATQSFGKIK